MASFTVIVVNTDVQNMQRIRGCGVLSFKWAIICHVLSCQSSGVIIGEAAERSSETVCAEICYQGVFSRSKTTTAVAGHPRSVQDQAGKNSSMAEALEETNCQLMAPGRGESVLFRMWPV